MNFMRFKWLYFLISALVIIPGVFSLVRWGLNPSIDFTGGSILELKFQKDIGEAGMAEIRAAVGEADLEVSSVVGSGEGQVLLKSEPMTRDEASSIIGDIAERVEEKPAELRFETVGPVLGQELLKKTFYAIGIAAGFILLYVWWQFKNPMFGVTAILAMFHDTLVLLGVFSLLGHFKGVEVDTLFVTAVLTVLSFSVHDTVVVYDRVRESQKKYSGVAFVDLVNKAITETLSRSINNSMTIIFMLLALFLLGGETIRWFVLALLIGTISGTFSSTFTAAPLLVVWNNLGQNKKVKEFKLPLIKGV